MRTANMWFTTCVKSFMENWRPLHWTEISTQMIWHMSWHKNLRQYVISANRTECRPFRLLIEAPLRPSANQLKIIASSDCRDETNQTLSHQPSQWKCVWYNRWSMMIAWNCDGVAVFAFHFLSFDLMKKIVQQHAIADYIRLILTF